MAKIAWQPDRTCFKHFTASLLNRADWIVREPNLQTLGLASYLSGNNIPTDTGFVGLSKVPASYAQLALLLAPIILGRRSETSLTQGPPQWQRKSQRCSTISARAHEIGIVCEIFPQHFCFLCFYCFLHAGCHFSTTLVDMAAKYDIFRALGVSSRLAETIRSFSSVYRLGESRGVVWFLNLVSWAFHASTDIYRSLARKDHTHTHSHTRFDFGTCNVVQLFSR